jgi:plastocyanin
MKVAKYSLAGVLGLLLTLMVASSRGTASSGSLVGLWHQVSIGKEGVGTVGCPGELRVSPDEVWICGNATIQVNADGTYVATDRSDYWLTQIKGRWRLSGNVLTMTVTELGTDMDGDRAIDPDEIEPMNETHTGTVQFSGDRVTLRDSEGGIIVWERQGTPVPPDTVDIYIRGGANGGALFFEPREVTVKPGTTVRWVNQAVTAQVNLVVTKGAGKKAPKVFERAIGPTQEATYTFQRKGTYRFRDTLRNNPVLDGRVYVKKNR